MFRKALVIGLVCAALFGMMHPVRAATITPSLLRTINTSAWALPSPDPMGLGYNRTTNRLLVTDSEIEEFARPYWRGANYWETSLSGSVQSTSDLTGFTNEPTDVAFNPGNGHYYISDDNTKTIYEITPGSDGRIGTSDDTRRSFKLGFDCEGLDYGTGSLWVADGAGKRVHRIQPGSNGIFEGAGDDVMSSFDIAVHGMTEAEDVFYDDQNGSLFIGSRKVTTVVETTLTGSLLNSYNLANTGMKNVSGLVIAPTSSDSSRRSLYVADRGADNDSTPDENDGKIFEYLLGAALPPGTAPNVTNPGDQTSDESAAVNLQINATDAEDDTMSFSSNGLPPGLSIGSSNGRITGTVASGAATNSPYTVEVTVSDGLRSSTVVFQWRIRDLVPPAAPTGLVISSQTNGLALDWSNSSEPDLAGYDVWRSPTGVAGSFTKLNTTPLATSDYVDTQATAGASSFYEILAVDESGNVSPALPGSGARSRIALVSSTAQNASAASISLTKPSGVAEGDLLIAGLAVRGAPTMNTPSGWTKIGEHTTAGSSNMRQAVYAKLAGASEPSSWSFTFSTSVPAAGTILAYRGAGFPVAAFAGQPNASSTSITAPSITAAAAGVEVGFFGIRNGSAITPPAGMVEHTEMARSTSVKIASADDVVGPGALGTRVATAASSAVNVGQVVLLRNSNQTPVVTSPGPQQNLEGDAVSLAIAATDAEGEPLAYGATGLPPGLSINAGTGAITGTVLANASANSPYSVTVTANDGTTTGSASFTWTINDLVAPAAPAAFTSTSTTTALLADWANNAEPDIAGYNIYRSPTGDPGSFTKLNTALLAISAFTDVTAPAGLTSVYEVTAVDESGNESAALRANATRARINFVGAASNSGSVTSLSIPKPAGVEAEDILLAVVGIRGTAVTPAPSGWTKILEQATSSSPPLRQTVLWKLAGASEGSSYAFSVGGSAVPATGTISAYRGAASPVALQAGQANGSSTSITAPSLTPTNPQSVEVGFFGTAVAAAITPPAGMVEQAETQISSTSNRVTISTADDVVDAGAIGTRVAAAGSAGTNVGQVVVLKPAGPQPPSVTNPGPQESFDNQAVTLAINATDFEGDPFTFSATGLPPGLSIDANTGVVSGTVGATAHTASPYAVTVGATDATGSGSATFTWTIRDPNAPVALDVVVGAASDDAEESPAGAVDLSSSDIELVTDGGTVQTAGVRFPGVTVPQGATIASAWIQFQADEASSEATTVTIKGQAADNAATFATATSNISSRARTTAASVWTPVPWSTVGEAGIAQRTPDLAAVLQEIVDRPGWASGNAAAFVFTGTGRRVAEPFEGGPLDPKLHIEYTVGPPPPPPPPGNAAPVVTNPGNQTNFEGDAVNRAITATDAEGDAITYEATGLPTGLSIDVGTGVISGTVQIGAAASSPYTVTVTARDATGAGSTTFTWTIRDPSPAPMVLNIVMASGADDVEESAAGAIDVGSSDLELVAESSIQKVGLRFAGVTIPAGATITAASIQFQVDEVTSGAVSLTMQAHDVGDAAPFTTATNNVSSRPRTTAAVTWSPPDWTAVGAAGAAQKTPNLAAVLQEIIDGAGWASGNAIAIIITGSGKRVATSFESGPDHILHIEYTDGPPPPLRPPGNAAPVVTNPGNQTNFEGDAVNRAITATDAEGDAITYEATGLPTGLSIDVGTGVISGTVQIGAAASSPYTVTVTARDATGAGSTTFTWTIRDPSPAPITLNIVMTAPADDMEEASNGTIDAGSSDLELVQEGSLQTVGLRFAGVTIPAGATITNAWIQFQTDEASTGTCNLLVQGEDVDDAAGFTTTAFNISSRARTSAGAAWAPASWSTIGEAGAAQRTSNLAAVVQEIVSRSGWASGNAMAFIVTGTGKRVAESFEGGPIDPTLHIDYTV